MDAYKVYSCSNMLLDASRMSGSFSEINEWMASTYMPKLREIGLKNNAVVLPQDIFAQLAIKDWLKKVPGLNSASFVSLSEALNWLALA